MTLDCLEIWALSLRNHCGRSFVGNVVPGNERRFEFSDWQVRLLFLDHDVEILRVARRHYERVEQRRTEHILRENRRVCKVEQRIEVFVRA